jgi:hypothetical protein
MEVYMVAFEGVAVVKIDKHISRYSRVVNIYFLVPFFSGKKISVHISLASPRK